MIPVQHAGQTLPEGDLMSETLKVNVFTLASIVEGGSYPATGEEYIASFMSELMGDGYPPIPVVTVGYAAPAYAPLLLARYPWLSELEGMMPSQTNKADEEGSIVLPDGSKSDDSFVGWRLWMLAVIDSMSAIVEKYGSIVEVEPLTDEERHDLIARIVATIPDGLL